MELTHQHFYLCITDSHMSHQHQDHGHGHVIELVHEDEYHIKTLREKSPTLRTGLKFKIKQAIQWTLEDAN